MYSKMLNRKMFEKWVKDFRGCEFMKGLSSYEGSYEIYKAIYEQAVSDTEERLRYEYETEREEADMAAYRDGVRHGREEGWDEGYEEGHKDGYKEGKNSI